MIATTQKEIEILREGGRILARILSVVAEAAKPGVETRELDALAAREIKKAGAKSSFKGYHVAGRKFPAVLCVSVNDEAVHGLPSKRVLKNGDLVGLDFGIWYKGLCTDAALTVGVGLLDEKAKQLNNVTRESLERAITVCKPGAHIGDIGHAVQSFAEARGFGVIRELVGHGVGLAVHEDPQIPNWGNIGTGEKLVEGMVIAIEPMLTEGSPKVYVAPDGWAWKTKDGSRASHFEHTLIITKTGAEVLTRP
ncbi:MAG: type I methionyl aminopeptidase [Candidatus Niyogibacteria bacterium]|nr:type I methionyl aminopeptidase [Candidatus Niyogibacteria bacterium]